MNHEAEASHEGEANEVAEPCDEDDLAEAFHDAGSDLSDDVFEPPPTKVFLFFSIYIRYLVPLPIM